MTEFSQDEIAVLSGAATKPMELANAILSQAAKDLERLQSPEALRLLATIFSGEVDRGDLYRCATCGAVVTDCTAHTHYDVWVGS